MAASAGLLLEQLVSFDLILLSGQFAPAVLCYLILSLHSCNRADELESGTRPQCHLQVDRFLQENHSFDLGALRLAYVSRPHLLSQAPIPRASWGATSESRIERLIVDMENKTNLFPAIWAPFGNSFVAQVPRGRSRISRLRLTI